MIKFRKNDIVQVITGKDSGKQGAIISINHHESTLTVAGINIATIHRKPSQKIEGGIIKKEMPIHISNVALINKKTGLKTKVTIKIIDGKKVRVARSTNDLIDGE